MSVKCQLAVLATGSVHLCGLYQQVGAQHVHVTLGAQEATCTRLPLAEARSEM